MNCCSVTVCQTKYVFLNFFDVIFLSHENSLNENKCKENLYREANYIE